MKPRTVLFTFLAIACTQCAGDYYSQYDASIQSKDYTAAKSFMELEIHALTMRDYNPTLPLRIANAYYRLAYAHGMLGRYGDMQRALSSGVSHDPGLANHRQRMLEYFEVVEYNKAVTAYNSGDTDGSIRALEIALSLVDVEQPHERCTAMLLRTMTYSWLRSGSTEKALELCRRAKDLGDDMAVGVLKILESGETPDLPPKLPTRETPLLRFL